MPSVAVNWEWVSKGRRGRWRWVGWPINYGSQVPVYARACWYKVTGSFTQWLVWHPDRRYTTWFTQVTPATGFVAYTLVNNVTRDLPWAYAYGVENGLENEG